MSRVLFVFLDGVGIGPAEPDLNPFFAARLPVLTKALGGRLPSLDAPLQRGRSGLVFPVDALLGVDGIPQSGTGQISLFTGRNAPELFTRHFGPWPPVRLRPILEEENFLRVAADRGARVAFANAYPPGYPGARSARRVAVPPLAARSAGALVRTHEALAAREALASEIVNDGWRAHVGPGVPHVSPGEAGEILLEIHRTADLTVFAHYTTDLVGHRGGMEGAIAALERVDGFMAGVLGGLPDDTLLLLASDHGNIEDVRGGHTRNPALGGAFGAGAPDIDPPRALTDVAGLVLQTVFEA